MPPGTLPGNARNVGGWLHPTTVGQARSNAHGAMRRLRLQQRLQCVLCTVQRPERSCGQAAPLTAGHWPPQPTRARVTHWSSDFFMTFMAYSGRPSRALADSTSASRDLGVADVGDASGDMTGDVTGDVPTGLVLPVLLLYRGRRRRAGVTLADSGSACVSTTTYTALVAPTPMGRG